ncbi:MAG TPA: ABC transporter substrate-binding protein [Firmicutes bacterium]|nr:ABC transporter substrate-binding protein [Bacillota bacterium]
MRIALIWRLLAVMILVNLMVCSVGSPAGATAAPVAATATSAVASAATTTPPEPIPQPKVVYGYETGRYGGELTGAVLGDPGTFNPVIAADLTANTILDWVFDGLVEVNALTGEVEPALAASWDISTDGRTWTFHLRRGVVWHDDQPFTAADVLFTLDVIHDHGIPTPPRQLLSVNKMPVKYEAPDDYTIVFHLPEPYAPFLRRLTFKIVPRHLLATAWREGRFMEMWGAHTSTAAVIGTGPFRLVRYEPGQKVELLRHPRYWKTDAAGNRLPYLTKFTLQIVGTLSEERELFQRGLVDYFSIRGSELDDFISGLDPQAYQVLAAGPSPAWLMIVFNQNKRFVPAPQLSWFTNQAFRQAVAHAVNREALIEAAWNGRGTPQWSMFNETNKAFHCAEVRRYPYQPELAGHLLQSAGFYHGEDGRLFDAAGRAVKFTITTNAGHKAKQILGSILVEDLRRLGMDVDLQLVDYREMTEKLLSGRNWDCLIISLAGGDPEPDSTADIWTSGGSMHWWNLGRSPAQAAWEKRLDELFHLGRAATEPAVRKELYDEAQRIVAEELPVIFTANENIYTLLRQGWHNVRPTAWGGPLHQLEVVFYSGSSRTSLPSLPAVPSLPSQSIQSSQ